MVCAGGGSAYATGETPLVVERPDEPKPAAPTRWSLGASIGPIVAVLEQPFTSAWPPTYPGWSHVTAWQLELLRRRDDQRMIFGGALEGTYGGIGPQLFAAHAFLGRQWWYGALTLETGFGIGLEAAEVDAFYTAPFGQHGVTARTYETYHLGLYCQGAIAAALSISDSLDVLLQFAVHVTPTHDEDWFGASMLGVRYALP